MDFNESFAIITMCFDNRDNVVLKTTLVFKRQMGDYYGKKEQSAVKEKGKVDENTA